MWAKALEFGLVFGRLDEGNAYDLQQLLNELLEGERCREFPAVQAPKTVYLTQTEATCED
jgi:hypothetical protein